jgi:hypothetical protein
LAGSDAAIGIRTGAVVELDVAFAEEALHVGGGKAEVSP